MFRHINKNIALYSLIGLVTLILACGSSGGGGGGGGAKPLATGTFIKTAVLEGGSGSYNLFSDGGDFIHDQELYRAQDINGSGNVSTVRLRFNENLVSAVTCQNVTIKLGHTSVTDLVDTMTNNVEEGSGSLVTVLNNATLVIPAGSAGDYFDIPLSTAFNYNGVDNLVLDITRTAVCNGEVNIGYRPATVSFINFAISYDVGSPDTATNLGNGRNDAQFVFTGGDNAVFTGPGVGLDQPFTSDASIQRLQQLYLASDIDGSGPITGLGIQVGGLTTARTYTATVKLGHATVSSLELDYAANYSGTPTIVANAVTFNVPAGVPDGSYVWIPLTGSFNYNGIDNLILEIDVSAATGVTLWRGSGLQSVDTRIIYGPSDASVIYPITKGILHAKFRFNGGTMDVITPGDLPVPAPFNTDISRKEQLLVDATSLGTGGSITKVAFRLMDASSTAHDYSNFEVKMGVTSAGMLSATYADNFETSLIARPAATFSLPAGLIEGDWIEVPLSTPFNYDPTKNLVIQATTDDTGINANNVLGTSDVTRYLDHAVGNIDPNVDTTDPPQPIMLDLRLWISK